MKDCMKDCPIKGMPCCADDKLDPKTAKQVGDKGKSTPNAMPAGGDMMGNGGR